MTRIILVILLCFTLGCASDEASQVVTTMEASSAKVEKGPILECFKGIPRGETHCSSAHSQNNWLNVVLEQYKGEFMICVYEKRWSTNGATPACMIGAALIQSEMNDGDNEEITVWGVMQPGGIFTIHKILANGHYVTFPE